MQISSPDPKHKRRLTAATCPTCGKDLVKVRWLGRVRRFCSNRCRQAAFRNEMTLGSGALRNVPKTSTKSTIWKGENGGRAFPLNLVGGHRWPAGDGIDRDLLCAILAAEIDHGLISDSPAESSGVPSNWKPAGKVDPDDPDFEIPEFLGRRARPADKRRTAA